MSGVLVETKKQRNIIDLLIEHEKAVSRLYDAYASKFGIFHEFWTGLVVDELKHAEQIRQLGIGMEQRTIVHDSSKLILPAVQMSIDYVKKKHKDTKNADVSFINALSVALSIEKSIIDGGFFDTFKGITKDAKQLVQDLKQGVKVHYEKIDKMWREHRKFA